MCAAGVEKPRETIRVKKRRLFDSDNGKNVGGFVDSRVCRHACFIRLTVANTTFPPPKRKWNMPNRDGLLCARHGELFPACHESELWACLFGMVGRTRAIGCTNRDLHA